MSETMEPALNRGDTPLKINNTATAIVASVGIAATAGVIIALALAGWKSESIIALATLAAGIATGQVVATRKAATVDAKTDQQNETLAVIADQTNGHLKDTVSDAVEAGIARAVAAYRADHAGGQLPTRMPPDPTTGPTTRLGGF